MFKVLFKHNIRGEIKFSFGQKLIEDTDEIRK